MEPYIDEAMIAIDPILAYFYFHYQHLPLHLQDISREFTMMAISVVTICPRNPERTVALRKLLEAKDCAVRAMI